MKKFFYSVLPMLIIAITLCSCEQKVLPQPVFPLEAEDVSVALQESDLSWEVSDKQSWFEGHSVYTLTNQNGQIMANVSSASIDGARGLIVAFMPPDSKQINNLGALNKEDWGKVFKFATLLYGDFNSTDQVFSFFSDDAIYDSIEENGVIIWEKEIRNIHCFARLMQLESNPSEKVLTGIEFYNSKGLTYFIQKNTD